MSTIDEQVVAVRTGVVLHRPGFAQVAVHGDAAYEAVDALSTRDLFVRTGQILHSLLLDEGGGVLADLYVCPEEGGLLLLADGIDAAGLIALLRTHAPSPAFEVEDRGATHSLVAFEGPYAWELVVALGGPELSTLGYMQRSAVYSHAGAMCFRVGTTGEFGYVLQVPESRREAVEAMIKRLGARFDLVEVGEAALARCSLENGFFNVRHRGVPGRSPLELQLQWRVTYDRSFRGCEGLRAARERADLRRVVWVIGRLEDPAPALGGAIHRGGVEVGVLLEGHRSPILECFVGLVLLDRALAYPWIDGLFTPEGLELRTEAPPLLHNRSLFIDPRKHIYAGRADDVFPPIVPGGGAPEAS